MISLKTIIKKPHGETIFSEDTPISNDKTPAHGTLCVSDIANRFKRNTFLRRDDGTK